MDFFEVKINCTTELAEILIAELAELGFDSFVENATGFDAFVEDSLDFKQPMAEIFARYTHLSPISYEINKVKKVNWNEEWEKNYHPIIIEDQCIVRASFHVVDIKYPYEIIINPKMSFGTGHHETTSLMLTQQLATDHSGLRVLDVGCGTGILAIMAAKRGAKQVEATDIDEWSVENSLENFQLNSCSNIKIQQGKINEVQLGGSFELILANINRNVLLEEIPSYCNLLHTNGKLILSGFYEKDVPDIENLAFRHQLKKINQLVKNNWVSVAFEKIL